MRADKLDVGEFGPLGYVFAHQVAHADAIAPSAMRRTCRSPITRVSSPGRVRALRPQRCEGPFVRLLRCRLGLGASLPRLRPLDERNRSRYGRPAALRRRHTASFETLRDHKVDAGELNSIMIDSATRAGEYTPGMFKTPWTSQPIPNDHVRARRRGRTRVGGATGAGSPSVKMSRQVRADRCTVGER